MNTRKQLQKAINHTNKALMRLDRLSDDSEVAFDTTLVDARYAAHRLKLHLLLLANDHDITIDTKGMPK